ncbi:hypothetical protein P3L10_007175 [Capsicum annuum]|nr:uncharacterized protein LOC107861458 [Capsicum annuum]
MESQSSMMKQSQIKSAETSKINEDEYGPLSGEKPYCDMFLSKTSVKPPYNLYLPRKMQKWLPSSGAPVVLTCGKYKWDVFYGGEKSYHKFNRTEWKKFVTDKNLKEGDAVVFELTECSANKIDLRVIVLRDDLPYELIIKDEDKEGARSDNPIILG